MKKTMTNQNKIGHLCALFTVFVWGITFVSTKVLLSELKPIEILFIRFTIGLAVLLIIQPKVLRWKGIRQEVLFALAGLTGVTLYFLCENVALSYTYAFNVSLITSTIPFLTAIAFAIFFKEKEHLNVGFFLGFILAVSGIALISLNGVQLKLNPMGDLLAVGACITWVAYTMIYRKIDTEKYSVIEVTQRIFIYGLIAMIPFLFIFHFDVSMSVLMQPAILLNLLFLGIIASGLCYLTWNYALIFLGSVKTSVYLYLPPVITVVFSVTILHEKMTILSSIGILLTLGGLICSENYQKFRLWIKKDRIT